MIETDPSSTLCFAPMRGIGSRTWRNTFCQQFGGLDRIMAPFIPSVKGPQVKPKLLKDIQPADNTTGLPMIPQVIGNQPADILLMIRTFEELGYTESNWNLGCPWPQVAKKKRGSGLMPHPDMIRAVLDTVCPEISGKLSVKLRLGYRSDEEIFSILPLLDDYPLSEVIIHPRTAAQMYTGQANPDAFARCLPLTRHRLCYNGDIYSAADFIRLSTRFPSIQHWMIGRGLLRNPFLAADIKGLPLPTDEPSRRAAIHRFHEELYASYREQLSGPGHVLGKMKEVWSYLASSFTDGRSAFRKIRRCENFTPYEAAVDKIFTTRQWQPEPPADDPEWKPMAK